MTVSTVFLLVGSTGEYDYYRFWTVGVYRNKELAESIAAQAQIHASEYFKKATPKGPDDIDSTNYQMLHEYQNPFDAQADMDYTGIIYQVKNIDLVD